MASGRPGGPKSWTVGAGGPGPCRTNTCSVGSGWRGRRQRRDAPSPGAWGAGPAGPAAGRWPREQVLSVLDALVPLFPEAGLRRGTVVAERAGRHLAGPGPGGRVRGRRVVGGGRRPAVARSARGGRAGVALDRLVLVDPARAAVVRRTVVAALDGVDVVLVGCPLVRTATPAASRPECVSGGRPAAGRRGRPARAGPDAPAAAGGGTASAPAPAPAGPSGHGRGHGRRAGPVPHRPACGCPIDGAVRPDESPAGCRHRRPEPASSPGRSGDPPPAGASGVSRSPAASRAAGSPPDGPTAPPRLVVWCPDWPVVAAGAAPDARRRWLQAANRVVAASPAARADGVQLGQRRREAQARCPAVTLVRDPARDARAFESVLQALERFTPLLEVTEPGR